LGNLFCDKLKLSKNFSFGTASLDLNEKAAFMTLFRKPASKLTEFLGQAHVRK